MTSDIQAHASIFNRPSIALRQSTVSSHIVKGQFWSHWVSIKAFDVKSNFWQGSHTDFDSQLSFADISLTLEASRRGLAVSMVVMATLIEGQTRVDFSLKHLGWSYNYTILSTTTTTNIHTFTPSPQMWFRTPGGLFNTPLRSSSRANNRLRSRLVGQLSSKMEENL